MMDNGDVQGARLPGQFVKPHRMQGEVVMGLKLLLHSIKMYFPLFVSLISVGLNIIKDRTYD